MFFLVFFYLICQFIFFMFECRWWSKETIAIVTGANKGIGFALVKRLAELGLTVILTARDVERGQRSVESLSEKGLPVNFFQLDVSDPSSIEAFVSWFKSNFAALDILVSSRIFNSFFCFFLGTIYDNYCCLILRIFVIIIFFYCYYIASLFFPPTHTHIYIYNHIF